MTKYYKIQGYDLFALSRDTKKSTYVFIGIFLHLMGAGLSKETSLFLYIME
jgi:hypothetical protein